MFAAVAKASKAERTLTYVKNARATRLAQQVRQLGDIRRDASRLIPAEQCPVLSLMTKPTSLSSSIVDGGSGMQRC